MLWVKEAWNKVTCTCIVNCWYKAGLLTYRPSRHDYTPGREAVAVEDTPLVDEMAALEQTLLSMRAALPPADRDLIMSARDYEGLPGKRHALEELNDDELIALVSGNQADDADADADADSVVEELPISNEQAAIHVQDLITWCLNHSNCELHLDHLGKLRDTIKQKQLAGLTQAHVTDFFRTQHL